MVNFFYLDKNLRKCAKYHADKHLNKMQVEYAQIASSVWWVLVFDHYQNNNNAQNNNNVNEEYQHVIDKIYKKSHPKHPVVLWAKKSIKHYLAVVQLGLYLGEEKRDRIKNMVNLPKEQRKQWKVCHASEPVLQFLKNNPPPVEYFVDGDTWVDPPKCMPDYIKKFTDEQQYTVIESYRLLYASHKYILTGIRWEPYVSKPNWFDKYHTIALNQPDIMSGIQKTKEEEEAKKKRKKERDDTKKNTKRITKLNKSAKRLGKINGRAKKSLRQPIEIRKTTPLTQIRKKKRIGIELTLPEIWKGGTKYVKLSDLLEHEKRKLVQEKKLKFEILKGITNHSTLLFHDCIEYQTTHKGNGNREVEKMDLELEIIEQEHHFYERRGEADLFATITLSLEDAIFDCVYRIPSLLNEGESVGILLIGVKSDNSIIRIRGLGMPKMNQPKSHGDLYLRCMIDWPQNVTENWKKNTNWNLLAIQKNTMTYFNTSTKGNV